MGKRKEIRAKAKDIERRWAARFWLGEAIQRALVENIDVTPAMDLLAALENLDTVEVIEDVETASERVVRTCYVGPTHMHLQDGQVMRVIGKTDPMLTLPETSEKIVSGKAGGRFRTPAEVHDRAFAAAVIQRFRELGMDMKSAAEFVEEDLGPAYSTLKAIRSGTESDALIQEFEKVRKELQLLSKPELTLLLIKHTKISRGVEDDDAEVGEWPDFVVFEDRSPA